MSRILALAERLLPALLVAAAVALLTAGMVAWLDPSAGVRVGDAAASPVASAAPGEADPGGDGPATDGPPTDPVPTSRPTRRPEGTGRPPRTPRPVLPTAAPTPQPTPTVRPTATPTPTVAPTEPPTRTSAPSPRVTPRPSPTATPSPTRSPRPSPTPIVDPIVATRVVIAAQDIDLPIISRDQRVKGQGPDKYPPCDVALYHTAFQQPGEAGTTYLYAHARGGMFLPLLEASTHRNGAALIGALVQVYTSDDREHVYQITKVRRHALDFSLALDVPPGTEQLILQTSEGPRGTVPKLQVLAEPIEVLDATARDAQPRPHPRACYGNP